jgi:hypothetical protein
MESVAGLATALTAGTRLALQFNPLAAIISAPIAAALFGFPSARVRHRAWAVLVLLGGWLVGDGLHVLRWAAEGSKALAGGVTLSGWTSAVVLGLWALGGLALGYAAPAIVGSMVGRRVTWGTGWLAAGSVAAGTSFAITAAVAVLGA